METTVKILCSLLLLLCHQTYANVNTLSLIDSYRSGSDTVCVYGNSQRTETWVKDGAGSCPSHMTFGSDDEE